MIRNRSLIRCAVVLAAGAGLLAAQGTSTPSAGGRGQFMAHRLDKVAAVLNLSDQQKSQVQTIVQNSFAQAKPLFAQLKTNRQAIEQLVKSGNTQTFDQQLQPLAVAQGSAMSQLTALHAKAFAQVWNLLTPDQRTKAEQLHGLLGAGFGGGMMGGRHMMGMHSGAPPASQQ